MEYALLVYSNPDAEHCETSPAFLDDPRVRSFVRLPDVDVSTTIRISEGRTMVTDGPFAETKEVFGGIIVIEAADMDEALAFATTAARTGSTIEVRPVLP